MRGFEAEIILKDELVAERQLNDKLRAKLDEASKATQLKKNCCLRYSEMFTTVEDSHKKLHIDFDIAYGDLKTSQIDTKTYERSFIRPRRLCATS